MSNQFPTLHIVDHPLVQHKLSVMRDKNTSVKDFRALVGEIAMLLTYEATRDLPMTTRTIETPICSTRRLCWQARSWPSSPSCGPDWALRTAS